MGTSKEIGSKPYECGTVKLFRIEWTQLEQVIAGVVRSAETKFLSNSKSDYGNFFLK